MSTVIIKTRKTKTQIKPEILQNANHLKNNFITCGIIGWALEVFWTGCISALHHDRKLTGRSSLFMFPIYGMACVIEPVSKKLKNIPMVGRAAIYAGGIFTAEYGTGCILKKHNCCPWDYSKKRHNVKGVINLDYAPVWFIVGMLYESVLCRQPTKKLL